MGNSPSKNKNEEAKEGDANGPGQVTNDEDDMQITIMK